MFGTLKNKLTQNFVKEIIVKTKKKAIKIQKLGFFEFFS